MTEARLWLSGKVSYLVRVWISWWRGLFAFDTSSCTSLPNSSLPSSSPPCGFPFHSPPPPPIPALLVLALLSRASVWTCRLFSFFPFLLLLWKRLRLHLHGGAVYFCDGLLFPVDVGAAFVARFLLQLCAYISAQITSVGYIQVTVWSVVWRDIITRWLISYLKKASTVAQVHNTVANSLWDIASYVVASLSFPTARRGRCDPKLVTNYKRTLTQKTHWPLLHFFY